MTDFSSAHVAGAPAPGVDIDARIAELVQQEPPTPQAAKVRNAELEQLYLTKSQQSPTGDAASGAAADTPPEGLEPPSSPLAYTLEQSLPPGVEVVDQAGLGALKSSLHSLGVPIEIANGAFAEIASIHGSGAFLSDSAYDRQAAHMRATIAKVHGEDAPAILRDAKAHIDKAVAAGKLTPHQVDALVLSPMAVSHAALLARNSRR